MVSLILSASHFKKAVNFREYEHKVNVDPDSVRICDTNTKKPTMTPIEEGQTYPLLASFAGAQPTYYDCAMVAGAVAPELGETIIVKKETFGVGIYVRRND